MIRTIFLCWAVLVAVGWALVFVSFIAVALEEVRGFRWRYFRQNFWAAAVVALFVAITAPVSVPLAICAMLDEGEGK